MLQHLLALGFNPNEANHSHTGLSNHLACRQASPVQIKMLKLLIQYGFNLESHDNGKIMFNCALERGNSWITISKEWIQTFPIHADNLEFLDALIANGFDINHKNEFDRGATWLHCMSNENVTNPKYMKRIQYLLDNGASVNVTDDSGITPLQIAARNGN